MNVWHDIDSKRISKDKFVACIEISAGSKNKYELDKETGLLRLDRILYTSTHYPANYGFIPHTYAGDKDPLDVLVICNEVIVPMTLVDCYPIGVIKMMDQGEVDEKIIAICEHDPIYSNYHSMEELPPHIFDEIQHFFRVYKTLENKETSVDSCEGKEEAKKVLQQAIDNYNRVYKK